MRLKKSKSSSRLRRPPAVPIAATTNTYPAGKHLAFIPLLSLVFILWVLYRSLFRFPVWFDETIGKAVFFGLPVWLYISLAGSKSIAETFAPNRIHKGLILGITIGGLLGFGGTLATLLQQRAVVQAAPLFTSDGFWGEFFLAMMTGFWETLFFFSWIMTMITEKYRKWPLLNQVLLTTIIFVLFHIPNTLLRFELSAVFGQFFLLFFFALGQAFLFARTKNLYALALSHAIWGMVLVIHTK